MPTPAEFVVTDLTISPATAEPGESVTISAWVTNTGDIEGTYPVLLEIEGTEEARQEITLAPGASQMVIFSVSRDVLGSYGVEIDGLQAGFDIEEAPVAVPWSLILGIIAGVVAVGSFIFFVARRKRGEAAEGS